MLTQGSVITRVYTSDAYLPLANVPVIYTQTAPNGITTLLAIRYTDSSGMTMPLYINTPSAEQSLSPNQNTSPYATINITTSSPGYNTITAENVQIFAGVETLQDMQLRPLSPYEGDSSVTVQEPPQNL